MVSTLESLFKYGLRDFKGLAIETLWNEKTAYNVVRLDFSEIKNFESIDEFTLSLTSLLVRRFSPLGFVYRESNLFSVTDQLSDWLLTQPQGSLVLLIDEYDAPLTACLNDTDVFNSVRKKLSNFYSTIKSKDDALRFFFMTGITKFNKTGIFSELNNLTDISLDSEFGSLLGYTHKELELYFDAYLDRAAEVLKLSRKNLVSKLTEYYDGFCFSEDVSKHVFVPWSTLNFLQSPRRGFKNYWYESGGQPKVLLEYIKSHNIKQPSEYLAQKEVSLDSLSASSNVTDVDDNVLLTQAGYLTIKAVRGNTAILGYPNEEVAQSMARLYTGIMLSKDAMNQAEKYFLATLLEKGDAPGFVRELNKIFQGIDYTKYPIQNEAACRAAVYLMLRCTGLEPLLEVHNVFGRSALEVDAGEIHWVLEFKFVGEKDSAEGLCKKGVEQVKANKYGEQFERKHLRRMVLVFAAEEKQFVCWSEAD